MSVYTSGGYVGCALRFHFVFPAGFCRVLTLFSKSLPLEIATRLWDVYLYEDEVFLFRAIIGLLRMLSSSIQSNDFDTNMHLMTHLPADMDSDALFRFIAGVPLSESELNSAIRQFVVDEK